MPNLNQYDKDRGKQLIIKKDFLNFFHIIQEIFKTEECGFIKVNKVCYAVKPLIKLRGLDSSQYRDNFNKFLFMIQNQSSLINTWWETYCQFTTVIKYNNHYCQPSEDKAQEKEVKSKELQKLETIIPISLKELKQTLPQKTILDTKSEKVNLKVQRKQSLFNMPSLFDTKPIQEPLLRKYKYTIKR